MTIHLSPATARSSSTLLQTVVPDVPQPTVRHPQIPASFPTSSAINRHEKAVVEDDNIAPIPNTPLTPATQQDNVKQDVKSLLHELGVLPIAPCIILSSVIFHSRNGTRY